jgi:hypothetical protein
VTPGEEEEEDGTLVERKGTRDLVDLDMFDEQIKAYLDLQSEVSRNKKMCLKKERSSFSENRMIVVDVVASRCNGVIVTAGFRLWQVAGLKHVNDIDFLHVNAQPVKQAISTWVAKWIYLFTQYLQVIGYLVPMYAAPSQ